MASALRGLLNAATSSLPRKCVTSSILISTGDSISQHAIERKTFKEHDYLRSARIAFYSGCIFAPIFNGWLTILNKIQLPNKITQTAVRVTVDQAFGAPFFPALFFTSITLLEGGSLEDVKKKLQNAWFKTWCTAVVFFTPASIINLSIIAPRNRLLFVNCVGLTWGIFLANTNNRAKLDQDSIPVLTGIEAEAIHAQDEKHM